MGTLYLVATPIGNLEDITLRALRVLKEVPLIAAEDTRTAKILLSKYAIHTPLTSYHDHNKGAKLPLLLAKLRLHDIALISEAGMPGLNDPGFELVQAAVAEGHPVSAIPGPSVVPTALVLSGLPPDRFLYLGYLPRRPAERQRLLESIAMEPFTLLCLETPHRLREALQDILALLGNRRIAVCREMTKLHEEVFRGTTEEAIARFPSPRGEVTLVIAGATPSRTPLDGTAAAQQVAALRGRGFSPKEAAKKVAQELGRNPREVYQAWLEMERTRTG
jgi:16S rRNA (cytidine1402-2'-O)-methyltransferase